MNYWQDGFEVGTCGNFGNDAAVGSENINLRDDDVTENLTAIGNDRRSGFVARRFDGENFHMIIIAYFVEIASEFVGVG